MSRFSPANKDQSLQKGAFSGGSARRQRTWMSQSSKATLNSEKPDENVNDTGNFVRNKKRVFAEKKKNQIVLLLKLFFIGSFLTGGGIWFARK